MMWLLASVHPMWLELKVAKDIAESKAELVRWVVGVGVLQMTLIVSLMLKLTHSI